GSRTSRTLVPNCLAQQLVVFLPLSVGSASRTRRVLLSQMSLCFTGRLEAFRPIR
ncbi:hypothetical protein KI387_001819, partial [Taxus chinensis]